MELSVVIPACNEEKRIRDTLLSYARYFSTSGLSHEIIVEMDGCVDNTAAIVHSIRNEYPHVKTLEYAEKLGKGGGLVQGFQHAQGDFVGFVDADGSVQPEDLMKLLAEVRKGADCAIASRRMTGSVVIYRSKARKFLSKCFNVLVRSLFALPYHDTQCGAKLYRRNVLNRLISDIHINGFVFDVVLLYLTRRNGFTVKEVPVKWVDKTGSKVNIFSTTVDMLSSVISLRVYYSPLRRLMLPHQKQQPISKVDTVKSPRT